MEIGPNVVIGYGDIIFLNTNPFQWLIELIFKCAKANTEGSCLKEPLKKSHDAFWTFIV